MQAVHEDIRFRNIGIWYDEFLETGYDFSEEIKRAIRDSRMFAMVVTPNILTNGGYNYVKEQEYPLAASLGKPVLPVEFVKTDYAKLKEEYKGISAPVSSCDKYGFCHALESVFPGGNFYWGWHILAVSVWRKIRNMQFRLLQRRQKSDILRQSKGW